ncbi:MAG: uroporphyrinogen-III synthase [Rhodospirillales bacterium]|nr:uroporphyrinogen-III synthase [Rhodospirillales bacterium]
MADRPRALVTRPLDDASPLAEKLSAMGFEPVVEPLLKIRFLDDVEVDFENVQAFAFTSANGVRALVRFGCSGFPAALSDAPKYAVPLDLPVFAVGAATANAARAAGFKHVTSADGDVDDLARQITETCDPTKGAILHVAGRNRRGDLAGVLEDAGFEAQRVTFYEADLATTFSDDTLALIKGGEICTVLIFSPRTGRQFVSLMKQAGIVSNASSMCLAALSKGVAVGAAGLPWGEIRMADEPNEAALLETIKRFSEKGKT